MPIVDEPEVTPEYVAIADALRPHGRDNDRIDDLTWQQVVGIASTAVAPRINALVSERDAAVAQRDRVASEAAAQVEATVRASESLVAQTADAVATQLAEAEGRADWWRIESEKNAARLAALEELATQARARWAHEGGPSPLRDAFDALDSLED